ncbi:DUF1272 domain-containing protein [Aeromonas sp. A-5]
MLELRPNCECCDQDLPADTAVACFNPALKAALDKGR